MASANASPSHCQRSRLHRSRAAIRKVPPPARGDPGGAFQLVGSELADAAGDFDQSMIAGALAIGDVDGVDPADRNEHCVDRTGARFGRPGRHPALDHLPRARQFGQPRQAVARAGGGMANRLRHHGSHCDLSGSPCKLYDRNAPARCQTGHRTLICPQPAQFAMRPRCREDYDGIQQAGTAGVGHRQGTG